MRAAVTAFTLSLIHIYGNTYMDGNDLCCKLCIANMICNTCLGGSGFYFCC